MIPFHITGGLVLGPEGLSGAPLSVAEGRIAEGRAGKAVHLPGWEIRAGIVDVHGDGFERHLAPRRGALRDLPAGLMALDAELAANGITTAVLAQFFSWEGGMRSPDFARDMLEALDTVRPHLVTDMRAQLRVETHLIDRFDEVEALIVRHDIRYVVFNDHLPHDALDKGRRPPRLTGQALKSGRSPEAHLALLQKLYDRGAEVPGAVSALAARLAARGVLVGSHDDADATARRAARDLGLTVSEFPETQEAALEAVTHGDPVVLGAPNVVRGRSHAGKVAAADLIREGLCTAIASDYHYPAPVQAADILSADLGQDRAWALVSSGPAGLLGLADRGVLAPGRRADIVAVNPATGRPGLTIAGGRIAHADAQAAAALLSA
ncbi:alkylphosphonate utilization protein PhnM, putative [Pseudooceanicola batsensis HTCC2597]|uniref:Alkylphosphonate utilization protein PhnM, putative n=1 Tax=Pseudooceanicola batsensis (strain ATCC BAA-863 / DSM 15984 / KCTC 12145 / HTCC2597) TaxID=252305 RepID=A3TTX9_PSEBH|nr:alpha-D-ribose 1-methylphosphonate 5-triphosphate diphosphatase [Pseudooceanicola batsensis]EAQ05106.1 alkylphosphonate utilization protein PhnM, putative [Pseudooceanicola batsensis HTCC2597]